jgi:CDP-6-deoxy-D-xylo-4-hexulose-3-dehydrase
MIPLVKDTIDEKDINFLIEWLKTNPKLTKGEQTIKFEKMWSEYTGVKYSVYVNSGSSANLAMAYALKLGKKLRNNVIVAPAVSWVTTVAPFIQLGYDVILCDTDKDTLGIDINHLKKIISEGIKPSVLIFVHVLGIPSKMTEIEQICEDNDIVLLEDSCESIGSKYDYRKTGSFGLMSSFSFYFAHHLSTIEGGMICTDDFKMYNILKSIRAHGWNRDLDEPFKTEIKKGIEVESFKDLYTFYYPGFNFRSTDLQAYIGLIQMNKLDIFVKNRHRNFNIYQENIKNDYWKINPTSNSYVSNFAYPLITPKIKEVIQALNDNNIETRPLICGSIKNQPFWKNEKHRINYDMKFSEEVDKFGLYLPNNHQMTEEEVLKVCEVVNGAIN